MIDFRGLLRALAEAQVRFIIVGGAAATAHGSARLTQDLDLVYDRAPDNLRRLVAALGPHEPYLRGAPENPSRSWPSSWRSARAAARSSSASRRS